MTRRPPTQLQYAITELSIVFDAARNVLTAAEYDVFLSVAVALVARRVAQVLELDDEGEEWRQAA